MGMLFAIARRVGIACVAALVGSALLGAPAVAQSLDDALKIIDQARGTGADKSKAAAPVSFVPPPRTIDDITAILDRQKPDPAKLAANRAIADAQPPAGADPAALADFYFKRGLAATELGRTQQRLADFKQASDFAQKASLPPVKQLPILQRLTFAYDAAGDFKSALEVMRERQRLVEDGKLPKAFLFNILQNRITDSVRLGRIDVARGALAHLENLYTHSENWPNPSPIQRKNFQSQLLVGRVLVALATGQYVEAEETARECLGLVGDLVPAESALNVQPGTFANLRDNMHASLANALLMQGRVVEAEAEARITLLTRLERFGRFAPETASDIVLLARVLFEARRSADSEKLSAAARNIYETLGYEPGSQTVVTALFWQARAQVSQGKIDAAMATYGDIERAVSGNPNLRRRFLESDSSYGVVLVRTGRAAHAVAIMERNLEQTRTRLGERSFLTAAAHGWLGFALFHAGQIDRAKSEFETAMPILLSPAREAESSESGGSDAQRDRILQVLVEAYMELLADSGGAVAAETFHAADAVRGRTVERALAESSARTGAGDRALADLVRHEQDAEKQVAALQGLLTNMLTQPSSDQDPGAVTALRQQIDQLRGARARVREEIEKRFPSYAQLIDPRPATVEEVQKNLRPGEALIATYVGDQRLFVWAVPQQGAVAFASTKITGREVFRMVQGLRKSLDADVQSVEQVPAFDLAAANKLYAMLLQPVAAGWSGARSLMVVPHRSLGQLPFGLLVTEPVSAAPDGGPPLAGYRKVPFLIRKLAVNQLPSVAALATLRSIPAAKGSRQTFAGFGDPWFSAEQAKEARAAAGTSGGLQQRGGAKTAQLQTRGISLVRRSAPAETTATATLASLPRLPDTADEVRSIALALRADPAKDVFLGAQANEKTVTSGALANRRIIVFATHGLVPGDLGGLTQPALALSSPAVAGGGGDGLLTVEKILGLKLDADWVVLSACNTAAGQGAGTEAVSGLGRAFFYAGTRALLVSNWPVETLSARTLTTDLFKRIAEDPRLPRAEALRQAELALIDGAGHVDPETKKTLFSYAHPMFWAPFTLVGDGG
jgi:CHAT domain-containing protein